MLIFFAHGEGLVIRSTHFSPKSRLNGKWKWERMNFQFWFLFLHVSKEDSETDSKRKILTNLEETMEQELQCAICTELLIEATALNCSHSFCHYCIKVCKFFLIFRRVWLTACKAAPRGFAYSGECICRYCKHWIVRNWPSCWSVSITV